MQQKDVVMGDLIKSVQSVEEMNTNLNHNLDAEEERAASLRKTIKDLRKHIGCDEETIEQQQKDVNTLRKASDVDSNNMEAFRMANASLLKANNTLRKSNAFLLDELKETNNETPPPLSSDLGWKGGGRRGLTLIQQVDAKAYEETKAFFFGLSPKRSRCTDEFHSNKVAKKEAIKKADKENESDSD